MATLFSLHQATGHLTAYLGARSVARGISERQAQTLQKGLKLLASDVIYYCMREGGEKQEVVEQQSILGRSSIKDCNQSISHSLLP